MSIHTCSISYEAAVLGGNLCSKIYFSPMVVCAVHSKANILLVFIHYLFPVCDRARACVCVCVCPCGVSDKVLIVSISNICLFLYFYSVVQFLTYLLYTCISLSSGHIHLLFVAVLLITYLTYTTL